MGIIYTWLPIIGAGVGYLLLNKGKLRGKYHWKGVVLGLVGGFILQQAAMGTSLSTMAVHIFGAPGLTPRAYTGVGVVSGRQLNGQMVF